ncbi:MAG: hypothetical protein KDD59_13635 [Bdellovibrionales bacterium]|nr:hypothetical protein [Bdellovibrionales bacterium]
MTMALKFEMVRKRHFIAILWLTLGLVGCQLGDNRIRGSYKSVGAISVLSVTAQNQNATYEYEDTLYFEIHFSSPVDVVGAPVLELNISPAPGFATYESGSGTDTLVFRYLVQREDVAVDLDYRGVTALQLAGGSINASGSTLPLDLTLPEVGSQNSLSAQKDIRLETYCKGARLTNLPFAGGVGLPDDPYTICTADQLNQISDDATYVRQNYSLRANVDMSYFDGSTGAKTFNVIGSNVLPFVGQFRGNRKKISNLYINSTNSYVGLFGQVGESFYVNLSVSLKELTPPEISELVLVDPVVVSTGDYVGALAGAVRGGMLRACHVQSTTNGAAQVSGGNYVGGLIGAMIGQNSSTSWYLTSLTKSSINAVVSGATTVGGLIGWASDAPVMYSFTRGTVSGTGSDVGGVVGFLAGGGSLSPPWSQFLWSEASVDGDAFVGGVVGRVSSTGIKYGFSRGSVKGNSGVGGVAGHLQSASLYSTLFVGTLDLASTNKGGIYGTAVSATVSGGHYWDQTKNPGLTDSSYGDEPNVYLLLSSEMADPQSFSASGWDFLERSDDGEAEVFKISSDLGHPVFVSEDTSIYRDHFSGGDGSPKSPWSISTIEQLKFLATKPALYGDSFVLHNDLDLAEYDGSTAALEWPMIGHQNLPFSGQLDGGGHTISNLTIERTGETAVGFISNLLGAHLKNLNLHRVRVSSDGSNVGALAGFVLASYVDTVHVEGRLENPVDVESTSTTAQNVGGVLGIVHLSAINQVTTDLDVKSVGTLNLGGLIGFTYLSHIAGSLTRGTVSTGGAGVAYVAGVVGHIYYGIITECGSEADITAGNSTYVGGLMAAGWQSDVIKSFARGAVHGDVEVGGFVGYVSSTDISLSYAEGDVTGSVHVGGFAGQNATREIYYSYANGTVTGVTSVGGFIGYLSGSADASWSFWNIEKNPALTGIGSHADPVILYGVDSTQIATESTFTTENWDFEGETTNGTDDFWRMPTSGPPVLSWE